MPPDEKDIALQPGGGGPFWRRFRAEPGDPAPDSLPGLDPVTVGGLFGEEKRPRCVPHGEGALVILRGVNLNPGAAPEDMISVRVWIDPAQLVTVQYRDSMAVDEEIAFVTAPTEEQGSLQAALPAFSLAKSSRKTGKMSRGWAILVWAKRASLIER